MALIAKTETPHGLKKDLYWRLNSFDQFPNREPDGSRVPAIARFRAFLSEKAFQQGKHFIAEQVVTFVPAYDGDIRAEAYVALKALDIGTEQMAVDAAISRVQELRDEVDRTVKQIEKLNDEGNTDAADLLSLYAATAAAQSVSAVEALVAAQNALEARQALREQFTKGEDA